MKYDSNWVEGKDSKNFNGMLSGLMEMEWMIYSTYTGDCMRLPELVDGSVEDGHSKDESPVYEVDEKSRRVPEWTRELHPSGSLGVEEVFQVGPGFRIR